MINDNLIKFIKDKYSNIYIKEEDDNIVMFHSGHLYNETLIKIKDGVVKIPSIQHSLYGDFKFEISKDKALSENDILFTGIYLISNCLSKEFLSELKNINPNNTDSVVDSFEKFYILLNTKGIVCNTIIYDPYYEVCFSVFTDDKTGLIGYILHENDLYSYSVDTNKLKELYDHVNLSKNVNAGSRLHATDESILKSYFENNGFFTVCDLLCDYDFRSLMNSKGFITIDKVLKSESKLIQDLVNNNQLSLYEEE